MRMTFLRMLLFSITFCACIGNRTNADKRDSSETPRILTDTISAGKAYIPDYVPFKDSSRYPNAFNEAKWLMYCVECDNKVIWRKKYSYLPKVTFGLLNLRYTDTEQKNDTLQFIFDFYLNDTLRCDFHHLADYFCVLNGVAIDRRTNKKLYFIQADANFSEINPKSRFDQELQTEVIAYIRLNRKTLDPWFREEAMRRKVIQ